MDIHKLLRQAAGQTDEVTLCQILSNRIDYGGGAAGAYVSGSQFDALAEDIKTWRDWANARDAIK